MDRKNIILVNEENDFALTIMYPMSGEHDGMLILLYEDSLGDADFKIMTPKAIAKNYDVSLDEILNFYDEIKNEKEIKNEE